ncbi:MAG: hypothetical protein ACT6TH_15120 [Brevundimonas sp.]|uniref:hypothetical protein n=1 Tax=Brevundimonas sp. TaxID=1871086 RepID=UPI004034CA8C
MADDLFYMLSIDALGAGDLRAFATQSGDPRIGLSINAEIKSNSVLKSVCGYGETFSEALHDLWRQLTEYEYVTEYVVMKAGTAQRRAVRWNGQGFKPHHEDDRTSEPSNG